MRVRTEPFSQHRRVDLTEVDGEGHVAAVQSRQVRRAAHQAGLTVTPYTFTTRGPATRFGDVGAEMRYYLTDLGVDALFTDNPDRFPRPDLPVRS